MFDELFMDEITFVADGVRYQIPVNRLVEVKTNVYDGGSVSESYDAVVRSQDTLLAIASGSEVKARLSGGNGQFDKTLTWREIEIIRRALKTYENLGGRFDPDIVATIKRADYATPTLTFTPVPTPLPPHIVSTRAGQYGMTTLDYAVNMGGTVKWNDCRGSEIQFRAVAATKLEFERIGHYDKTPFTIDLHTQSGDLVGKVFEGERIEGYASSSVNLVPGVSDYLLKVTGYGCWHITMTAR